MRIIGSDSFGADQDRVALRAQSLSMFARCCARDPASFAGRSSETSVQTGSALRNYKRNSSRNPFVERLVEVGAFLGKHSTPHLYASVLQDLYPPAAMARVRIS